MSVSAATNTVPPGWSFGMSANTVGGVTIDTAEKFSGEASMKLWNLTRRTKEEYVRISYDIPVKPGHSYRYGFMAKVENGNGNIYCQMNWDRSALTNLVPTGKTADWRAFEFVYNNNGSETSAAIRFCMENYTDGLWIDDMYFYDMSLPQTPENNLIKNPSFEGFIFSIMHLFQVILLQLPQLYMKLLQLLKKFLPLSKNSLRMVLLLLLIYSN